MELTSSVPVAGRPLDSVDLGLGLVNNRLTRYYYCNNQSDISPRQSTCHSFFPRKYPRYARVLSISGLSNHPTIRSKELPAGTLFSFLHPRLDSPTFHHPLRSPHHHEGRRRRTTDTNKGLAVGTSASKHVELQQGKQRAILLILQYHVPLSRLCRSRAPIVASSCSSPLS